MGVGGGGADANTTSPHWVTGFCDRAAERRYHGASYYEHPSTSTNM